MFDESHHALPVQVNGERNATETGPGTDSAAKFPGLPGTDGTAWEAAKKNFNYSQVL